MAEENKPRIFRKLLGWYELLGSVIDHTESYSDDHRQGLERKNSKFHHRWQAFPYLLKLTISLEVYEKSQRFICTEQISILE